MSNIASLAFGRKSTRKKKIRANASVPVAMASQLLAVRTSVDCQAAQLTRSRTDVWRIHLRCCATARIAARNRRTLSGRVEIEGPSLSTRAMHSGRKRRTPGTRPRGNKRGATADIPSRIVYAQRDPSWPRLCSRLLCPSQSKSPGFDCFGVDRPRSSAGQGVINGCAVGGDCFC